MKKLKADQLRVYEPVPEEIAKIKRNPIYFVLDRITDTYNIGSLFRLADAVAAEKMYLCGDMEYPPNSRVHRAAVGTEAWVPWTTRSSAALAVRELKQRGVQIIAVEQSKNSINYKNLRVSFPVAIVCGNETKGLPKQVLKKVDTIVELPMYGINHSFNVWGSTAVVTYKILESI